MKKQAYTLCFLIASLFAASGIAQRLTYEPTHPKPGDKIMLQYNPEGSPLAGLDFQTVVFLFDERLEPHAFEVEMKKDGAVFKGEFASTTSAKALVTAMANEKTEKTDNNDRVGYVLLFYQADKRTPVPGALGSYSMMNASWSGAVGNKNDDKKAVELLEKEFLMHPESKKISRFRLNYGSLAKKLKDPALNKKVEAMIAELANNPGATEEELADAVSLSNQLGDPERAKSIEEKSKAAYPKAWEKNSLVASFNTAPDAAAKADIFHKIQSNYANDPGVEKTLVTYAVMIANAYAEAGDWANFERFVSQIGDKNRQASLYNTHAWNLAGEGLEKAVDTKTAKKFSKISLQLMEEAMKNPAASKPSYMTTKQWSRNLEGNLMGYSDTYALTLYHNGEYAEALKYQQKACEHSEFADAEMNERLCTYVEQAQGGKEAEALLARFISEGKANTAMKKQHQNLFFNNNDIGTAYQKYIEALEANANHQRKADLLAKMINEKAPAFRLTNLAGQEVSLEGLRGKVVVVDFWATWCGPCKASFPGMQTAVNKFAQSDDVAFVFVDTWERVADKKKAVSEFIEANKYTFNVLMDDKNEVVSQFGVSGIPTKFILDKEGNIRFKSVGFNGNDDELVKEISLMIEMAGGKHSGIAP